VIARGCRRDWARRLRRSSSRVKRREKSMVVLAEADRILDGIYDSVTQPFACQPKRPGPLMATPLSLFYLEVLYSLFCFLGLRGLPFLPRMAQATPDRHIREKNCHRQLDLINSQTTAIPECASGLPCCNRKVRGEFTRLMRKRPENAGFSR